MHLNELTCFISAETHLFLKLTEWALSIFFSFLLSLRVHNFLALPVWSCLGVTFWRPSWQNDQVLKIIELKWRRVISFSIYLSRHLTQAANGMAPLCAPLLQPANEASSFRASLIAPLLTLCGNTQTRARLNASASRGTLLEDKNQPVEHLQKISVHNVLVHFHGWYN